MTLYVYIYNIRTLSVNIKFICTSFRNRQNSEPSASFSGLFRSECKWILYLTTLYVYCVYPAMSKKSENLVRFRQKGQKQASFLAFHKCCLPVSKARTDKFYIYRQRTYIVYISVWSCLQLLSNTCFHWLLFTAKSTIEKT
jgi:hypothetical protein